MNRKLKTVLCAALVLLLMFSCCCVSFADEPMPVTVKAKAAVLMDVDSGKVLMSMNADEKLYPASVTKIMTLLLVTEALDSGKISLSDTVTASASAASKGGSQIWLKEGEQMTVDDLLKATAVYSANDACTALGELLAGSDEAFTAMINERAGQLGMKNTHFDNCTGLDDTTTTHLTTAMDVAIMSRELLKHERIMNYTTIWMDSLRGGATELVNTNKLVRFYKGTTGLKTGTTAKAGCCVSASAKRGNTHLIAVVMGSQTSDDRFNGAKAMLNWGFANYSTVASVGLLLASFGGAFLNFYYSIFMWDKILHLLGGAEAVFMGYELATAMQKRDKKQCDLPIVLLCALGFSFFISTCWELFEFSFDQIAGGDSQHWSYELAKAANNTRTFFKPRDPARFALMDTMTDIVFNTLGAVPFYIILKIAPYHHKGKNNVNEMFAPKGAEKELAQAK